MYFITNGGLSVYDGVRFTNYSQNEGLANEVVNDVIEITPDSFLVATNSPKLNTLSHGKIGDFTTIDGFSPVTNRFLSGNDGYLYATTDDGLFILLNDRFIRLPLLDERGNDISQNLNKVLEWRNFLLIVPWDHQRKEKLILYNKQTQKITDAITQQAVFNVAKDAAGKLWISTSDGINQIDEVTLGTGKIKLLPLQPEDHFSDLKNFQLLFDQHLNTWLYTDNQIIKIKPEGQRQTISLERELKTGSLVDLFVDREGITWMASDGSGVMKLVGTSVEFLDYSLPGKSSTISGIHQQNDTIWWYNIADQSFYRLYDQQIQTFRIGGGLGRVSNIYTPDQSLYFTETSNMRYISNRNNPLSYGHSSRMFDDSVKIIEVGNGIVDPHGAIIQNIKQNDTTFYLSVWYQQRGVMRFPLSYSVDQMAIDHKGQIWAATRDDHILVLSVHPQQASQYLQLVHDYSEEIKGMNPRSIAIDKTGNVWIGTRYLGLFCLEMNGMKIQSIQHFTTRQGLTDNFIYRLYCDTHNTIWAGTQTGLDKISLKKGSYVIENVTKSQNIFKTIYQIIAVQENVIWALTSDGLIIRVTEESSVDLAEAPPIIVGLSVNGKDYETTTTRFRYDDNNFSVRVAAPSFTDEKSIRYSYQLKGSSHHNWSEPSNDALFNFINLAPGDYELNVKAEFPAVLYPPQTFIYAFNIRPPFWHTWWFRLLMAMILLSLLTVFVRYYYARKLEKQRILLESKQAMEKERTRIATDMHDDLGAGLTRIKFLSETIGIKKQLQLPIQDEIHSIRAYAHEMIDKMGEIVWALNEKNDSLSDLLAYTRSYAAAYLTENGVTSTFTVPDDFTTLAVSGEFRRNIFLSVKEALHNIIKHAQANSVIINFEITKDLLICIKDDGVGFDPNNIQPYRNGLVNMKKRLIDIGGCIEIKNENGTTVRLSAPLPT